MQYTKHKEPLMEGGETDNIQMNITLSDQKILKQASEIENDNKRCHFRVVSNY